MRIEIIFDGNNPDECVEAVWVRVEEKEHCLDWDESQYSAIEGEEIQLAIHTDYNKEGSYATV